MPCRCQNNMNFVDANYLYQQHQCPCKKHKHHHEEPCAAAAAPVILAEEASAAMPNPCCACNGCSCVRPCCGEEVEISCQPIDCVSVATETAYRTCCDCNGTCCRFPCCCRNPYWPSFAHPRWLCCKDLYSAC